MDMIISKIAYLDLLVYNIFSKRYCHRTSVEADVEGDLVKAIKVSYRVFRHRGITGFEITISKGKTDIKIKG